ncbi:MAG: TolC family protein [Bacteroidota bacterium]
MNQNIYQKTSIGFQYKLPSCCLRRIYPHSWTLLVPGESRKLWFQAIMIFLLLILGEWTTSQAQSTNIDLASVIHAAQSRSIAARRANTLQITQYWEWRSFKANYRPQVTLGGRVPGFSRTFEEVRQDNGSIKFQSIFQSNVFGEVFLSQPISPTGGTIFMGTNLQRFDDLSPNPPFKRLYNATPVQFGFEQPLFRFNELKWAKKIEPLRYKESQQNFVMNMAAIAVQAVDLYFDVLLAQTDLSIARTNAANTDTIFQITEEKYEMGKISRNDLLQIQLEKLKSAKALAAAEPEVEIAELTLRSYIGYGQQANWALSLPEAIPSLAINPAMALSEANANRPDATAFVRREIEARQAVARARGSTGFSANLVGAIGFTNSHEALNKVYQSPIAQQTVSLEFNLPILDWGRAKSQVETAKANQQLIMDDIEQDQRDFEQIILTELSLFQQYEKQVSLNKEVDEFSQIRYQIAQDRFLTGNLNITDLIIAFQEKDRAKRDYIRSLWEYWRSYHRIRELTLYDFERNQKLQFESN